MPQLCFPDSGLTVMRRASGEVFHFKHDGVWKGLDFGVGGDRSSLICSYHSEAMSEAKEGLLSLYYADLRYNIPTYAQLISFTQKT